MTDLESMVENEKGVYAVERKFSVMHYEYNWPPYVQRESTTPLGKKCRCMSDLLNKKIIRSLREEITCRTFETLRDIKEYIVNYCSSRVTPNDFGEMANVSP